jgi:uncharacterized membrane protein
MKFIRRTVVWLMHIGSWILSLYLFATGNIWGGFGAVAVSCVMGLVYCVIVVIFTADFAKYAEEGRKKAREEGYKEEKDRLRSA